MENLYKKFFFIFILAMVCDVSRAQAQSVNVVPSESVDYEQARIETQRLTKLCQKLEGTYQLQIIDSREKAELPLSILDTVEAKRHATDTVYFWLKSNVRIMVLPFTVIGKNDFRGIERVVYRCSERIK
jgi:hypothetical protein